MHGRDGGDAKTAVEKGTTCPYCRSNTAVCDYKFTIENEMKRANSGQHEAMCHLGKLYFDGAMGMRRDKAEGLKWYHCSLEAGSGKAAYFLGQCYDKGDGVEKDHDKALNYYQNSAELGYIPAFQIVGMILMQKGDIEEAFINLRKAAM